MATKIELSSVARHTKAQHDVCLNALENPCVGGIIITPLTDEAIAAQRV